MFTDELDDARRFVYVVTEPGREPVKRTVALGRSNDELVEIVAGLSVGEDILLEKPAPRKDASAAKPEPAKQDAAQPAAAANAPAATNSSPAPASK